ncbi:MAG: hypothetical protein R3E58_16775, partial [Phycisphaerae bacterium]
EPKPADLHGDCLTMPRKRAPVHLYDRVYPEFKAMPSDIRIQRRILVFLVECTLVRRIYNL